MDFVVGAILLLLSGSADSILRGAPAMGKAREAMRDAISRLRDNPKAREIIQVLPRRIAFELEGEERPFALTVSDGELSLSDDVAGADIVVAGDAPEFARIVSREREVTHAVAEGKVRVSRGKLSQMILFDRLLNLARKRAV